MDSLGFMYAVVLAAGGTYGYVKSGSIPSLAAGVLFGSAIGMGAYQISKNPENFHLALGTSTIVAGVMGSRFYSSGKIMPSGVICGIRFPRPLFTRNILLFFSSGMDRVAEFVANVSSDIPLISSGLKRDLAMALRYAYKGFSLHKAVKTT